MATIRVTSLDNYQQLIVADPHATIADEPPDVGDSLGPSPYAFLLGALGS